MNNFSAVTLVVWETRNWRHRDKASVWCKDYGLKPFTRTVWMGKLYAKEKAALRRKFAELFNKKTEKFAIITLCQSCFDAAQISDIIKRDARYASAFEIIQFPEIPSKH